MNKRTSIRMLRVNRQLFLIPCAILLASVALFSQCDLTVDAGPDQEECYTPAIFELSGSVSSGSLEYFWTPTTNISDASSLTPTATINTITTYVLNAKNIDYSQNLIENGDFSDGNISFNTDYTYNASPSFPGNQLIEGQYSIGTNPAPMHVNWVNCGDHTTGDGNMMIVNGSEIAGQNAWCQTVNISPNTEYAFSVWVTSVDPNGPCEIQFNINGIPVGDGNVGLTTTCDWINFFEFWNSGAATTVEICIEDINLAAPGNDFAIDDIVFAPTCIEMDEVTLTPIEVIATADSESDLCVGETLTLTATGGMTYEWYGPSGFIGEGSPTTFFDLLEVDEGTYTVIVTDEDGCTGEAMTELVVHESPEIEVMEYTCNPDEEDISVEYLFTQFGCDSIVTTNIILAPTNDIQISQHSCDPDAEGIFIQELSNQYGCDSTVTTTVILNPTDYIYILETVCDSSSIDTITKNLINSFGCDSTVVIERIYKEADSTYLQNFTCDSNIVGIEKDTFINIHGCDSIVFSEIFLIQPDSTYIQDYSCDISDAGISENILFNALGCDSIIFTETIFIQFDSTYIQDYSCDISDAGISENVLFNALGCDSIIFTETIFIQPDSTYIQDYSCDISDAGISENVLYNTLGCDSIVFTEIIFIQPDSTYIQDYSCDISDAGILENVLYNTLGCDSIVFTETIFIQPDSTYLQDYSCIATATGTFENVLINNWGCDSLIFTEIIFLESDSTFIEENTCDEASTGTFTQNLFATNGCDSIVTTLVNLIKPDTTYILVKSCDPLDVNTSTEVVPNQYGCDSTIITQTEYFSDLSLSLSISQPDCFTTDQGNINAIPSGGESPYLYSINSSIFQENSLFESLPSGEYMISIQDANGCFISETIILNAITAVTVDLGEDFTINIGDEAIIESIVNIPYDSITSIEWSPLDDPDCSDCLSQYVYPILTTTYSIEVTDVNGCLAFDTITIEVEFDDNIYVPNIISTNGDGINDKLVIFANDNSVQNIKSFHGFDRWGNKIWSFENIPPNEAQYGWGGNYKGEKVNSGVYVWIANIEFIDGRNIILTGDVTVIR